MRYLLCVPCALGLALAPLRPALAQSTRQRVGRAELSPQAEAAIDKGLDYLATHQNSDGSWGSKYQSAATSLALMAFMLKGHFPERGRHGDLLERAVDFLIRRSEEGGGYFGGTSHGMYEHGLATLALAEVWGMSDNPKIRDTLKRAVQIILRSQNHEGGWRYHPRPNDADISVTVMELVALASAQEAGILVPNNVIEKAVEYVKRCHHQYDGGFSYQPGSRTPRLSSTAAGVMSLQMCGQRECKEVREGLARLLRFPESHFEKTDFYYYAHYYAIQAMYQAGEKHYQQWYPRIQEALLAKQREDGSWSGGRGGTCVSTPMAILVLGVPYRFLPIYQR